MRGTAGRAGAAALVLVVCIFVSAGRATQATMQRSLLGLAYYVDYDANSLETLVSHGRLLQTIITTNFVIADQTGRLEGKHDPRVVALGHRGGARVVARVSNDARGSFNRAVAHAVLTDPTARARAMAEMQGILDRHGYDGVSIDFENVAPQDRRALTSFMQELHTQLTAKGRTLSIAVPPKTEDRPADDWSGAFDYAALARVSDWLIVMAYDEHWSTSRPGPVASLPWVERVIKYAVSSAPRSKVALGVPLYGYAWPSSGSGEGISMREAMARAARAGVPVDWDGRAASPYFRAADRVVHFENAESVGQKVALAARYGIGGIAAWRLGHEMPEVWGVLERYLKPNTRSSP